MKDFETWDNDEPSFSLPQKKPLTIRSSIEMRLYEEMGAVSNDADDFSPQSVDALLKDTRDLLAALVDAEKDETKKVSVTRLIHLIEENIEARSILALYLDRVKKV